MPLSLPLQDFKVDMYVRQQWEDPRLVLDSVEEPYVLDHNHAQRLWVPDLFFYNLKHSTKIDVIVPNMAFNLNPNGEVTFDRR